jgi:hypothetical protein
VDYAIRKNAESAGRVARQQAFVASATADSLRATYFNRGAGWREPIAWLHRWGG